MKKEELNKKKIEKKEKAKEEIYKIIEKNPRITQQIIIKRIGGYYCAVSLVPLLLKELVNEKKVTKIPTKKKSFVYIVTESK